MADPISGPAGIVNAAYGRSVDFANSARSEMSGFLSALNASVYTAPSVSVSWSALPTPYLTPVLPPPNLKDVAYTAPSGMPTAFHDSMDSIVVGDFTATAPTLSNAQPPTVTFGAVPTLPEIRDVIVPTAPDVTRPPLPAMLSIGTHVFDGINLHEDWLSKFENIPELSILQPTKLQYTRGPEYASQLLSNLKATIDFRLKGGSGLSPSVEQAIWDRARDRETQIALAKEREVMRSAESMGFPMPQGAALGALADARREYHDKLAEVSRDIAIKQADLEQTNLKDAIAAATQLESQLIDYSFKIESLAFEAAKAVADNEVQVFNSKIEHFKALLAGYQAYASAYDTLIKAELTKVEVYKAELSAEQTKAQINLALVQQYKAQIDGTLATVEIFKAQVSAAQTLVSLEQARMQAAGEQIRAFVAVTNAEVSKVELYKAQISADNMQLEGYKIQAQVYSAKSGVQVEKARVSIAKYQAGLASKSLEWDGWKAQLVAEGTKMEAAAKQASITVDGYRATTNAIQAQAEVHARMWESNLKQYEAASSLTLQAAKINSDALMHTNDARMEAAKVGAQVMSQQTASALSSVNTSAQISGTGAENHNHTYAHDA